MHFELAVDRVGPYIIKADKRQYKCVKIELRDQYLIGYEEQANNIELVEIPKDQIEKIYLYDKGSSSVANVFVGLGIIGGILFIYGIQNWNPLEGMN